MRETITISIPPQMKKALDEASHTEGVTRSEVVRESLRDYLFLRRFRALRQKMTAQAQAHGVYTDEDVFERVS